MTKITQLPVVSTMADQSVFVVVDNGVTKKLTYSTLKATLKGDKGETGLTGAKGDTGEKGEKGDKGETGAQGPVGPLAPFSTATDIRLGGIKIGTGVTVTGDGTLSVPVVTINTATTATAGTVSVGTGLQLNGGSANLSLVARLYKSVSREFQVNNQGFAFVFEGFNGTNPNITLNPGATYGFVLNESPNHPFSIRLANSGSPVTEGQWWFVSNTGTVVVGANANPTEGLAQGTLFWTIPESPSQYVYYYQCTHHASMIGQITIYNRNQVIDGRISTELNSVGQDILPDANNTRYLGSDAKRWHSLYVGPGSVDIGGVTLTEEAGRIVSSGGFALGKSITGVTIDTAGLYRFTPNVVAVDPQGRDFAATAYISPTTVESIDYRIDDTASIVQPSDTVTVSIETNIGESGADATADAVTDYFIKDVSLFYKSPPTAGFQLTVQQTLGGSATLTLSDLAQATSLKNFLPYVQLCEDRDALPTFLDVLTNQTKALKFIDVDEVTGVVSFDATLAFATIPDGIYSFEVPVLEIIDGTYPIICEGVQIGKVVAEAGSYAAYVADKLDSARLPAGSQSGDKVSVSCSGLVNSGQTGYWHLGSNPGPAFVNKTEVAFGVTAINLTDGGHDYITPPRVVVSINGSPTGQIGGGANLTPAPIERISVTNFGNSYTDTASVVLQDQEFTGNGVTVPTSDSNVWQVTTDKYPLVYSRTAGVTFYVKNISAFTSNSAISNGMTVKNLATGLALPGTVTSVSQIWNTNQVRLYQVNMTLATDIAEGTYVSFGDGEAALSITQQSAQPVLPATTSSLGTVIAGKNLGITQQGVLSVQFSSAPATSKGQAGDTAGMFAVSTTHLYYCTADYTTGTADIWKRVAWAAQTW